MPFPPLRQILLVALLAVACVGGIADPAAAQAGLPKPQRLTSGWQFTFDPANAGLKAGWKAGDWSQPWTDVEVPHVFDPHPTDANFLGTYGWYRLKFATPATPEGFGWALRFEGARRVTTAWLNGARIGHNSDPYEPFTLPAKGLRTDGQPNELVVRVQNIRPADLHEGWWNWGGLVRPVTLI